ncbi:GntR family transcriptional regulator [Proteinivorax hydrogeniformans]|uniref:GntR family transcriptional regulator n=1 Tax=Proteinivorax hydrogeniformans TaxID=1826727 RepID=A0AAU8HX28_9FIRM
MGGINIEFKIEKSAKIPLYVQVKNNIKELIKKGKWKPGAKIPTERELSKDLNVSRNTVSVAFQELESEGYLACKQGKGTFVAEIDEALKKESRKERLLKMIDITLDEGRALGFSIDEILAIAYVRGREKKEILHKIKVLFIECNKEQGEYISKQLSADLSISVEPIVLDDLVSNPEKFNFLISQASIIITTFFHIEQVKKLSEFANKNIIPIALSPHLETIVKIARFPADQKVLLVCKSQTFSSKVVSSLKSAGITHLEIETFIKTKDNEEELERRLEDYKYIITSPGYQSTLSQMISLNNLQQEVLEFNFKPDLASINLLKSAILEQKDKKTSISL